MQTNPFKPIVHAALALTPIIDRLAATSAVILERIARGGGATKWYYCVDRNHLQSVETQLSPGSAVSFYFDDRMRSDFYSTELKSRVETIIAETGEAVVGVLCEDGMHINVEIIAGLHELAEFVSTLGPTSRVFYGAFPARDNDGIRAVTVVLPDADGVVRAHPH